MKFCEKHWEAVKEAAHIRGMSHLVKCTEESALRHLEGLLTGERCTEECDPVLAVHNMIILNALKALNVTPMIIGPLVVIDTSQAPCDCPLCTMVIRCGCKGPGQCGFESDIIQECMDSMKQHIIARGALKPTVLN